MSVNKQASAPISDEELLRRMQTGDAAAFETLYDRRQPMLYRYALRMSGSPLLAEDVIQDVFLSLIREQQQFDPARGTLIGYLYGMTRHRLLRLLSRERNYVALEGDDSEETNAPATNVMAGTLAAPTTPLQDFERGEQAETVRQAVLALPAHYREVVVLCNLQELSYEQAAQVLGCPVGTVRSRLNRARALLIEKLRSFQQQPDQQQPNQQRSEMPYELSRI